MSAALINIPSEPRIEDILQAARQPIRCRIPQWAPSNRPPPSKPPTIKPKPISELAKVKHETPHARFPGRNAVRSRPKEFIRPNSAAGRVMPANRPNDTSVGGMKQQIPQRMPQERLLSAAVRRKYSVIPKRVVNDNLMPSFKPVKAPNFITVPVLQKQQPKSIHTTRNISSVLPDQETISKCEELELAEMDANLELNNDESFSSPNDRWMKLRIKWQDENVQFDKLKSELNSRQKAIMELYTELKSTYQRMLSAGLEANLPDGELQIMNVSNMTPEQLLRLCAETIPQGATPGVDRLTMDINKLQNAINNIPSNLVAICEQTLVKRKEIIDWFDSLKSVEKGITINKLSKKINDFNAENDMLSCTLREVKAEFLKELNDVTEFLRKGVNETVNIQLHTEKLNYEISELNAKNEELRKQLRNGDNYKSLPNKQRFEELEKELKEEKCKNSVVRDRLSRTQGQVKMGAERASQLEAALEDARSQTWKLERTVQQLQDQNRKFQADFDIELNKMKESVKEHTTNLDEIAKDRQKLQEEKEDLEKHLNELSQRYNESLMNYKQEMSTNVTKLIEMDKKYNQEKEERSTLENKIESMCTQLIESELRYKDTLKESQQKESELREAISYKKKFEDTKHELDNANSEIEDYKNRLQKQNDYMQELQQKLNEALLSEERLKMEYKTKEEYITELERKHCLLKEQVQGSESKMSLYEKQLSSLKSHITQLRQDFGEFEDLDDLHNMINEQREKMFQITRQNEELIEALQNKESEVEENIAELKSLLEQRDNVIKILSEKEEEQENIIKLLRNNLEMKAQADIDFNQQLGEKAHEINSLISNLDTTKKETCHLEKIILTLEDQTRNANLQNRRDQEKINYLEKRLAKLESYHLENKHSIAMSSDDLDNLIKILEDELGTPYEPKFTKDKDTIRKRYVGECNRRDRLKTFECHEGSNVYQSEQEVKPTKIVMGNFVKKTYIPMNEEQFKCDNLNRKKAITNIDTKNWIPSVSEDISYAAAPVTVKDKDNSFPPFKIKRQMEPTNKLSTRNIPFFISNQRLDEKKRKMFEFAGHRI